MRVAPLSIARGASYKWWAYGAISIGVFTSVADMGSVIVALPTISNEFGTDLPTTQLVVIAFALAVSALLMPMGRLGDIIGRKRIYLVGFAGFIIGALLAGSSGSISSLIGSRVVMGIGAAMVQGSSMAMVLSAFPAEERGKALGLQLSAVGGGGVAGPAVGGFIVDSFGWQGVFFTTAALGVVSMLAVMVVVDGRRPERQEGRQAFDWFGAALSSLALIVFLLAMTNGPKIGWGSPFIVTGLVGVAVMVTVFVRWELGSESPMLDVRLFKRKLFSMGVAASFISFVGNSSVRFLMPFYLQAVLGYEPRQIGLVLVPAAIVMIVAGPVGGRLSDRYGWRVFNVGGLLISATALFALSRLTESSPIVVVVGLLMLQSSGGGTFSPPNNSSILSTVEHSKYGVVSGFLNLVRNSANVTGIAITTALVTAVMATEGFAPTLAGVSAEADSALLGAFTEGLQTTYLIVGGFVVLGALLSLIKGDRPAVAKRSSADAPPPIAAAVTSKEAE